MRNVPIGTRAEVQQVVEFRHTLASFIPDLPEVLSTPHMIGLMETACFLAQKPYCDEGEITVGTAINVQHRAPTTIGAKVTAEAVLESFDGRFHIYRVRAWDDQKQLGFGTINRAVVNASTFMAKLQR